MQDVGRTREEIVSHKPKVSDLQAFRVLFQHSKWFTGIIINSIDQSQHVHYLQLLYKYL